MDMREVMEERHSVRKFEKNPLSSEDVELLEGWISEINECSGLDIRLITDDPKCFSGIKTKFTGFQNVPAYIAMCGKISPDLEEKVGYHGERLVLLAQAAGLNTCWAYLCSRKYMESILPKDERMVIGIAIGYGAEPGKPHKDKPVEKVADVDGAPLWFMSGVAAVMLAPSAMNRQDFFFSLQDGKVHVKSPSGTMALIDKGIAKLHFELGAGADKFEWA